MRNGLSQSTYDQIITYFLGQSSVYTDSMNLSEWHIYGSSRLGIYQTSINMAYRNVRIVGGVTTQETTTIVAWPSYTLFDIQRGAKRYELTNHLGNVLVVVSDKKIQICSSTAISYYIADLVSATDYSPGGAPLVGRSYTAPNTSYRFKGAGGQEADDDIFIGAYTAEYWEYDSRLGRRWNTDPMNQFFSPYVAFANNPICHTDPNGAWVPKADKDGNIKVTKEEGDSKKSLKKFMGEDYSRKDIRKLWKSMEKESKEINLTKQVGGVFQLMTDAINESKARKNPTNSDYDNYIDEPQIMDGKNFKDNYNCFGACIALGKNQKLWGEGIKNAKKKGEGIGKGMGIECPEEFDYNLSLFYTPGNPGNASVGRTVLRFGSVDEAAHGATYMGTDRSGNVYAFSKNGWDVQPEIINIEYLKIGVNLKYGDLTGSFNLKR